MEPGGYLGEGTHCGGGCGPPYHRIFRAILSTLKIKRGGGPPPPRGETRRFSLTTSTIPPPSEGKSFVSTNLGITSPITAERPLSTVTCGCRTLVSRLNLKTDKGSLSYLEGDASLDDVIIKDYLPGLDILPPGGGEAKQPHSGSEQ